MVSAHTGTAGSGALASPMAMVACANAAENASHKEFSCDCAVSSCGVNFASTLAHWPSTCKAAV